MAFVGRAAITLLDRSLRANTHNIIYFKIKKYRSSEHGGLDDLQECDSRKVGQLNQGYLAEIHDRLIEPTTFDFAELVADSPFWAEASFRTRRNVCRRCCHSSSRFLSCYRADQQQPQGPQP